MDLHRPFCSTDSQILGVVKLIGVNNYKGLQNKTACGDPPDPFFAVTKQKRKNSGLGTRLRRGYCHATNGPPTTGPAGQSMATKIAMDGPAGPLMAAMHGPAGPSTAP